MVVFSSSSRTSMHAPWPRRRRASSLHECANPGRHVAAVARRQLQVCASMGIALQCQACVRHLALHHGIGTPSCAPRCLRGLYASAKLDDMCNCIHAVHEQCLLMRSGNFHAASPCNSQTRPPARQDLCGVMSSGGPRRRLSRWREAQLTSRDYKVHCLTSNSSCMASDWHNTGSHACAGTLSEALRRAAPHAGTASMQDCTRWPSHARACRRAPATAHLPAALHQAGAKGTRTACCTNCEFGTTSHLTAGNDPEQPHGDLLHSWLYSSACVDCQSRAGCIGPVRALHAGDLLQPRR